MNLLIIGDIFGRPGRTALKALLPELKEKHQIDYTIVNGENSAHGKGITPKVMQELLDAGADFITTGNHIWSQESIYETLDDPAAPIIRPANFLQDNNGYHLPGRGHALITAPNGKKLLIINLMGRVFTKMNIDCPFHTAEKIIADHGAEADIIIVDFHAETTSEKTALAHYIDGKATVVYGTHTHVPTADYRLLSGGTAYITDLGMTGVYDSVIGVKKENILKKFLTQMPVKQEVAEGPVDLYAIKVVTDDATNKALSIDLLKESYISQ